MPSPHLAILGAGAIGIWLATRLVQGGARVSLIARPHSAEQLVQNGLTLDEEGAVNQRLNWPPATPNLWIGTATALRERLERSEDAAIDILLLTVKTQQLLPALPEFIPLSGAGTLVAFLQNGIPWWYFHGISPAHGEPLSAYAGRNLESIDPQGELPAALPLARVLGGVIHKSAELLAPGHVRARAVDGDGLIFGSPSGPIEPGGESVLLSALRQGGIAAQHSADIRTDVWTKLLGNAVLNPVSALADATLNDIVDFPPTRRLALAGMAEAVVIARACGVALDIDLDARLDRARAVGASRTSMLQDKRQSRELEIDGILGGLLELAALTHSPTPRLETLYAATALLSRNNAIKAHLHDKKSP
ncbi:MAG: 2-dehydropantoate 2-reductase [Azoarcus sp.]|jgi:2-dehydropantoate 2-reductase|nr:2-dehydropantoate 2-reductase [Azoarcus sp.]